MDEDIFKKAETYVVRRGCHLGDGCTIRLRATFAFGKSGGQGSMDDSRFRCSGVGVSTFCKSATLKSGDGNDIGCLFRQ